MNSTLEFLVCLDLLVVVVWYDGRFFPLCTLPDLIEYPHEVYTEIVLDL